MRAFLKGKKTNIVAATIVLQAAYLVYIGDMNVVQFLGSPELTTMLEGTGLAALRAGVNKFIGA